MKAAAGAFATGLRIAVAVPLMAAALTTAARWPIAPAIALATTAAFFVLALWRPACALAALLAVLPVLAFAPWTGWIAIEEIDLLLAGLAAGGLLRGCVPAAADPVDRAHAGEPPGRLAAAGFALLTLAWGIAALRGLAASGIPPWDPGQGYLDAANTPRLAKPLGWTLLLLPLLARLRRDDPRALAQAIRGGMLAGLALCGAAAVWERAAFPGLLDLTTDYRSSARFWEMHVGGAAIDGYLALAMPFALHATLHARNARSLVLAGVAVTLGAHACLTTFSRGVYLAIPLGLALTLLLERGRTRRAATAQADSGIRPRTSLRQRGALLALGGAAGCAVVFLGGSYMGDRFADSARDLQARIAHWHDGLRLIDGPLDALIGKGLGRWPAAYRSARPPAERLGTHAWSPGDRDGDGDGHLRLIGPGSPVDAGALHRIGQRVPPLPGTWTLRFHVRGDAPVLLHLELCEKHLLYPGACAVRTLALRPSAERWRPVSVRLEAFGLGQPTSLAPRPAMFTMSLPSPGASLAIDALELRSPDGVARLRNPDFDTGLAHWFFSSDHAHLPWHAKSLPLHLLVEQGLLGLAGFSLLCVAALGRVVRGQARDHRLAPPLAGAILAFAGVGLFDSLLDIPRISVLCLLLIACALLLRKDGAGALPEDRRSPPG